MTDKSRLTHRRTIGHAELRAEVFREQSNSISITVRITLGQVFHSFNEQLLTFDVASIANAWRATPFWLGGYRDRQYSGHSYYSFIKARIGQGE